MSNSLNLINEVNSLKEQISKDIDNSNDLLKKLVEKYDLDIKRKYMRVDFNYLLAYNIKEFDKLIVLKNCLKVIRKYATNLLRKNRPDNWKTIYFRNAIFEERVNPIIGSIKILNNLGYTESNVHGISFPQFSNPNVPNVQMILVDLLGIDMELHYLLERKHPNPSIFKAYFSCPKMNFSICSIEENLKSSEVIFGPNIGELPKSSNIIESFNLSNQVTNFNAHEKANIEWTCTRCTFLNSFTNDASINTFTCTMCLHESNMSQNQSADVIDKANVKIFENAENSEITVSKIREIFSSSIPRNNFELIEPLPPNYNLLYELSKNEIPKKRRIRMLLAEGKMSSWLQAEFALEIINQLEDDEIHIRKVIKISDVIDLASSITPFTHGAVKLLQQECVICKETYPSRMIENLSCICKLCVKCLCTYYEYKIANESVQELYCPQCQQPPILQQDDRTTDHFKILHTVLKSVIKDNSYKKLVEIIDIYSIGKELVNCPWGCGNGFIAGDIVGDCLICTKCKNPICKLCRRQWEDNHSCTSAQHEDACPNPNCRAMYILDKGGCLHITCLRCKFEFCSSCKEAYKTSEKNGLHCDHTRDCHFHLRDEPIDKLENLLKRNKIQFEVQIDDYLEKCMYLEAKDQESTSQVCNEKTISNYNWLCERHYKEYLIWKINVHSIDPISINTIHTLENMCRKNKIDLPSSSLHHYRELLETLVQRELPLKNKTHIPRFPTYSSTLRHHPVVSPLTHRGLMHAITINNEVYMPDAVLIPRDYSPAVQHVM